MGPVLLDPIFDIPSVSDCTTSTRDNANARNFPQSKQRRDVSGPACKGVTMVFPRVHLFSRHSMIFSSIHSIRAVITQNRINGARKYSKNKIHMFSSIEKAPDRAGAVVLFSIVVR